VIALPGLRPKSPEMTEGPVLVTVVPANTAKGAAVPKLTGDWDAEAAGAPAALMISTAAATPTAGTAAYQPGGRRGRRDTDLIFPPIQ
jgi:hypothetical protein